MKGMVFTELLGFVEQTYGADAVDDLIEASDLPSGGAYTAVGTYDHKEMQSLVTTLAAQSHTPPDELLGLFGQHLIGRFKASFPDFFKTAATLFDFLESIDRHIHVEVRKLYPDAELPEFRAERVGHGAMNLDYRSSRPFEALASGLILGAAQIYAETVRIERSSHENGGEKFVRFSIQKTGAIA
ncbi:heme NO-binding domain-containing protein [Mesorhizobium sp. M0047]|uniref:heme NO-binding domain-containing protein n=1 Tax=Mesorhizobium sp. M0047 TaxID=2956859 RepID=UPI0033386C7E